METFMDNLSVRFPPVIAFIINWCWCWYRWRHEPTVFRIHINDWLKSKSISICTRLCQQFEMNASQTGENDDFRIDWTLSFNRKIWDFIASSGSNARAAYFYTAKFICDVNHLLLLYSFKFYAKIHMRDTLTVWLLSQDTMYVLCASRSCIVI